MPVWEKIELEVRFGVICNGVICNGDIDKLNGLYNIVITEDAGLGTSATKADTIEMLIKQKFIERDKKNLVPAQKGINPVSVLPAELQSIHLTVEWENRLSLIAKGEEAGKCPNCKAPVYLGKHGFYCSNKYGLRLASSYQRKA